MKIGRQLEQQADEIQMAPLIDIIFLILVFFMVTSVYANLESEVDITLPTANSAIQGERTQGEIFINVREDGTIIVNERTMDVPELQGVLQRVAEYFPGGSVIIRADAGVSHGRVMAVLYSCRQSDIQNISFAAIKPETE